MQETLRSPNKDHNIDTLDFLLDLTEIDLENLDEIKEEALRVARIAADSLLASKVITEAVELLFRLDEAKQEEKEGAFKVLGVLENLFEIRQEAIKVVSEETNLLAWIASKVIPSQGATYLLEEAFNDNILYATEILSILMQAVPAQQRFHEMELNIHFVNFFRTLLELPDSKYPADYVEAVLNLFDSVCLAIMDSMNQSDFAENEGIDVAIKLLKYNLC